MSTVQVVSQIDFNTLTIKSTSGGQTTVDVVSGPTNVSSQILIGLPLVIGGTTQSVGSGSPSTVPLVLQPYTNIQTAVDTVPTAVTTISQAESGTVLSINSGSPGAPGPAGVGGGNVFIQNAAPLSPPAQYLWIQTGLGNSGQDMTFWVQP